MLPDGFAWDHAFQGGKGPEDCLKLDGAPVVRMSQRIDDRSWLATIDRHLDWGAHKTIKCTSYEAGRAGAETWATRHADRLRREVAAIHAKRPRDRI